MHVQISASDDVVIVNLSEPIPICNIHCITIASSLSSVIVASHSIYIELYVSVRILPT